MMKEKDGMWHLSRIEQIRRKNNQLHMAIQRIAWKRAPKQFVQLVKEICDNDKKITKHLRKMAGVENDT